MVAGRSRFSDIISSASDYVRDVLHWLPAAQPVAMFAMYYTVYRQVVRLAYKAPNRLAPSYPVDLEVTSALASRRPGLRSSYEIRLAIPRHFNKCAERAFAVACSLTWNMLPQAVRDVPRHIWATSIDAFIRSSIFF